MNKSDKALNSNKSIKTWREDERPREKLKIKGVRSLSDSELLAIVIREGTRNKSAIDVAKEILEQFKDLNNLSASDYVQYMQIKGIGEAKAILLSAIFEIARRVHSVPLPIRKRIATTTDVTDYYIPMFKGYKSEIMIVLMLDSDNKFIREEVVSKGIINSTLADPREIFRTAIIANAASIMMIHNHPSGNPKPSKSDIELTKSIEDAGRLLDIPLNDHIIIAGDRYYSFLLNGIILP